MLARTKRLELELGGKVRPLLFDFTFLDFLTETTPLSELDEIGSQKPWKFISIVALAAIQSGADFEGKKLEKSVDLKAVSAWIQDLDGMQANQIVEGYKSAMGFIGQALSGKSPAESPVL